MTDEQAPTDALSTWDAPFAQAVMDYRQDTATLNEVALSAVLTLDKAGLAIVSKAELAALRAGGSVIWTKCKDLGMDPALRA